MSRNGFNFTWMYKNDNEELPKKPDLKALDFLRNYGLDFVRIPLNYRFWIL